MTTDFVNDYLALGEGQRIEFKSVIRNIAELGKVACGFLNTAGGYIICGVDDRGIVSSRVVPVSAKTQNSRSC
ncbi:MAG: hypothetical protein HGB36_04370 [Chlorobiaceae bacterium]|nr:hypothetical protein [Chlorobiaceae bacterium]